MENGEVGVRKVKKQLCVRLEVGGLRQKAKSPINLINYLRIASRNHRPATHNA